MKATTKAIIAASIAVAVSALLIVWQARHNSAYAALTSLSPDDMSLIAESLAPADRLRLSKSPEERKKLSDDVKQILALAEEARAKGVADRPEVKRQLEAMKMLVVAQMYIKKQRDANVKTEDYMPKPEETEAFLKDPNNVKQADSYLEDLKKMGMVPEEQQITDEIKEQFRKQWAPMSILAQKGKAAGVESERSTQLQSQFQQAVALSRIYSNELSKKLEPTDEEIQAYFAAHPELDPKATRQKAEEVLKRARAGEDFGKLAKENSEEPGAKESGGELPWFGRAVEGEQRSPDKFRVVKPFEDASFALKDNEISDIVETPFGFHIIQRLGHRTQPGENGAQPEEQIHVRHILFKPNVPGANPFAAPKSPRDTAREAIIDEKTKKEVEEIAKRTNIKVPDDFPVKAPEVPPGMTSPHGGMQAPPSGDEDELPPPPAGDNANPGKATGGAKPKATPPKKK
ncbi:MAG: peptidyl-prolyl cis-trans isomerase [Acidobacteriota bacterium]|nr:peptidyl-prolyl cis-trans isomerase [Acidobacteriota bacterium]MDT5262347.1 peptidyl-prolyl cis-trans isomerase [Acidobacteriota bacterium]MDT7780657.1 peptidyl-prolyl cis-trans isomerase [Acidobacteriota bacterium]